MTEEALAILEQDLRGKGLTKVTLRVGSATVSQVDGSKVARTDERRVAKDSPTPALDKRALIAAARERFERRNK